MMCSKCGEGAFEKFRGRYYCKGCYAEKYESAVESSIRRYRMIKAGERVLVALSGGKDSVAMLSVLKSLSSKFQFEVSSLFINLGLKEYSRISLEIASRVCEKLEVELHTVNLSDYDIDLSNFSGKVCSVCGNAKRYLMNRFARENGYDVIATGHCSEDILANLFKNLYSGNFQWSEKQMPRIEGFDKVVTRIRPLYEMGERENMIYAFAKGLQFVEMECPKAPNPKWKEIVYEVERKIPGFKISVLRNLARRKEKVEVELKYCRICGEVTSSEVCLFCRNVRKSRAARSHRSQRT